MKKLLCTLAVLAALQTNAAGEKKHKHDEKDHAEHIGAHVHGVAQLNVVIDGNHLDVMLETPAMNVMGFEHKPETDEHLDKSHDALHALKDAEWLAANGGDCALHEVDIDWQYAKEVHAHFHKEDEHKEDEHKEGDHKHEHKHKHDEHDHSGHSDVDAKFEFECKEAKAVKSLSFNIFKAFSGFEKIDVQWISGNKQGAQTLTPKSFEIKFDK